MCIDLQEGNRPVYPARGDRKGISTQKRGTLALIAEARLNVLPIPKAAVLVALSYVDFDAALRDATLDQQLLQHMRPRLTRDDHPRSATPPPPRPR